MLKRLRDEPKERDLSCVKHHHFSFGDCFVAVTERANGGPRYPILFFLHGRFGQADIWWPIIDRLFPRFRCFSVDLPGFGHSFSARERGLSLLEHAHLVRRLVERIIDELSESEQMERRAVLVGHDIGGTVAQICALELKKRLAGMVLINCAGLAEPIQGIKAGMFGWSARWRLRRLLATSRGILDDAFSHSLLWEPWKMGASRAALIRALKALEISWPGPFERQLWKEELKSLSVPALLLWGSQDPMNDPRIGLQMVRELPEAYFYESESSGHWPNLDAPDWVSEKISEFTFKLADSGPLIERSLRAG